MATNWKLRDVFAAAARGREELPSQEDLYLPAREPWGPETEGIFFDDKDEVDDAGNPEAAKSLGLMKTIDGLTLEYVVFHADHLLVDDSERTRLYVLRYFLNSEEIPDEVGVGDPPAREEIIMRMDRKFYDVLGPDLLGTKCKRADCNHARTTLSLFCKQHHFENVQGKPCPFTD